MSDRAVRQAVETGAGGTVAAVSRRTGACTVCGGCREAIEQLLGQIAEDMGLAVPIRPLKEGRR